MRSISGRNHRTATELGERWRTEYGEGEEIVQTGRERHSLDVGLIQALGLECFTGSDSTIVQKQCL